VDNSGEAWITDADIMVLRESPTIQEFHQAEMKVTGICYSNSPRNNGEERAFERVTGLNYVTPEWYEKTFNARERWYLRLQAGEIGKDRLDDEIMLKKIIEESCLGMAPKFKPLYKRHHGIHFGTARAYRWHEPQMRYIGLSMRISPEQAKQWQAIVSDDEYKAIIRRVTNEAILWELAEMERFTYRRAQE
jgi:hypothetical protein